MNTTALLGRLVGTPELRVTSSNKKVISFTLAVRRTKEITDFIDCVAWEHNAEFITKYFEKGQLMAATGHITTRTYEDKNGNKRKAVEVVVDSVDFAGEKSEKKPEQTSATNDYQDIPDDDSDFPF